MFKNEGPYTRTALKMMREFAPTMIVWIVAILFWGWLASDDKVWLVVGSIAITVPYLVEYCKVFRR